MSKLFVVVLLVSVSMAWCVQREPDCSKYAATEDVCDYVHAPVCATVGGTFNNECEFCSFKARIRIIAKIFIEDGACSEAAVSGKSALSAHASPRPPICPPVQNETAGPRKCPKLYQPICASNGETFGNECMLCAHMDIATSELMVMHEGACLKQAVDVAPLQRVAEPRSPKCLPVDGKRTCSKVFRPICASNGETFSNECMLCAHMDIATIVLMVMHEGACLEQAVGVGLLQRVDEPRSPKCLPVDGQRACPKVYRPICASNGETFSNECMLCAHMDVATSELMIMHEGKCNAKVYPKPPTCVPPAPSKTMRPCTADYRPVCADDGKTYGNECAVCGRIDATGKPLMIMHKGECKTTTEYPRPPKCIPPAPSAQKARACPMHYAPVCADDGHTYPNECAVCHAIDAAGSTINIVAEGVCGTIRTECAKYMVLPGCPRIYRPVCHLFKTYANECVLCQRMQGNNVFMTEGACEQ